MDKSKKITIGLYALSIFLILGISYAYFSLNVIGNEDAKLSVVTTGKLELTYTDNKEITLDNAIPGDSFQKEISVKNTGTLDTMYNIIWQELNNEFIKNEIVISATCERLNSEGVVDGTCNNIEEKPIARLSIPQKISIEAGITHKYTVTVKFIDTGKNQNYNQGKTFNGKLGIEEYKDNTPEATYCTFDGELTEGAEYTNGQYTYRYKQHRIADEEVAPNWVDISEDGWGMILTDTSSTDAVTTTPCTYVNDKPVVSISTAYFLSEATSIDLSKLNTSNVKYMIFTFAGTKAAELDLSKFNTSNVVNMYGMFFYTQATSLDVRSFDTSNVTNMAGMFLNIQFSTLDLSKFDTSKVTDMRAMFGETQVSSLDLSNFDTSNVTQMGNMFYKSQATTLNVSNFDTSKVTNMYDMFYGSQVTKLDLSNFDTSSVTDMHAMFDKSKIIVLDLSSFDTKNVTDMGYMFRESKIKTIYASNKFVTNNVTDSSYMFTNCTSLVGGAGTAYDSTKVDKTYARIDGGTSSPGYFTSK